TVRLFGRKKLSPSVTVLVAARAGTATAPHAATTARAARSLFTASGPCWWGISSEDGRLGVGPEDVLKGGDDLALRGMNPRRVQKVRHQVLPLDRGRLAQLPERRLDGLAVAPRAHRPRA